MLPHTLVVAVADIDESKAFLHQLKELGTQPQVPLLSVLKQSHQPHRILFEDVRLLWENALVLADERIKLLRSIRCRLASC